MTLQNPMLRQMAQAFMGGNGVNQQQQQQIAINLIQRSPMANTPIGQNLITQIRNGNTNEVINVVKNLSQQQGINFDSEFLNFKNNL